ncbi:MAG: hypothetical protein ACLGJB_27065 [Blastocatellia bacterium]
MTVMELIAELRGRGVVLEASGERLRVDAPKGAVTPDLRAALEAHKTKILEALTSAGGRPLHYELKDQAVLGVAQVGSCLVGCGSMVKFYYQGGEALGYCSRCDVHQRIVAKLM